MKMVFTNDPPRATYPFCSMKAGISGIIVVVPVRRVSMQMTSGRKRS